MNKLKRRKSMMTEMMAIQTKKQLHVMVTE